MDFFLVNPSLIVQNIAVFASTAGANAYAAAMGETAIQRTNQNPSANIGDTVDASGNLVTRASAGPKNTILTIVQFVNLFTSAEQSAIYSSANGNVKAVISMLHSMPNGMLSLSDPMVIGWVNGLATLGLITAARATAILAT